jgi:hypothetical protein
MVTSYTSAGIATREINLKTEAAPDLTFIFRQSLHGISRNRGHAVAWSVGALCYKPEGHSSIPDEVIGFFN